MRVVTTYRPTEYQLLIERERRRRRMAWAGGVLMVASFVGLIFFAAGW